jgi:hypothetical protein
MRTYKLHISCEDKHAGSWELPTESIKAKSRRDAEDAAVDRGCEEMTGNLPAACVRIGIEPVSPDESGCEVEITGTYNDPEVTVW